ncbi:MAG TPA: NAD(P)-binding domain-containing protein [Candidatus Limnocylindria bacterium]|jgi:putative flavoprotein involved in K+ transport|nr:NAD(P)-binding domain-containing protein [Candidatus Limnocylindria bacterium]
MQSGERIETVIVGGGQAGLAVGYELKKAGRRFVIVDAHARVGDAWRTRWDSLRAFTPAIISGLHGMPMPGPRWAFPTKDDLADYFEAYAARFELPVRTGVTVTRVSRDDQRFIVDTSGGRIEADNVVIASGHEHTPNIPSFAQDIDPAILQIHSKDYRRPTQLRPGPALVVGAGNSGAEIALEISRTHPTFLSGRYRRGPVGPSRHPLLTLAIMPFVFHVFTIDTPIGRKMQPKLVNSSVPVERVRKRELVAAGVELVSRTIGVRDGSPVLDDGRALDVANVIWCTGYRTDLSWIDLPVVGEDGEPMQRRGVVQSIPGLYFVGRRFQYSFVSGLLSGVARDGAYIARQVAARAAAPQRAASADPVTRSA